MDERVVQKTESYHSSHNADADADVFAGIADMYDFAYEYILYTSGLATTLW